MKDSQSQEAGDNAQQYAAGGKMVVNQYGITEQRAREIFDDKVRDLVIDLFSAEAQEVASGRIQKFDRRLAEELSRAGSLRAIADPSFQVLLRKTQMYAASTEGDEEHEILTRLLVERSLAREKPVHMVVHRAVEVIDQIDQDTLSGITNLWFMGIRYTSADPVRGFVSLNTLAAKFQIDGLPESRSWFERADLLSCIRLGPPGMGAIKSWEDIMTEALPGYFSRNITEDEYPEVVRDLQEINLDAPDLIESNKMRSGTYRILASSLEHFSRTSKELNPGIPPEQIDGVAEYLVGRGFFTPDGDRIDEILQYIEGHLPSLHAYRSWWNSLVRGANVELTPVGVAVAFSNAKRFDNLASLRPLREQI
jgi:hypothetical protein